ncbi:MAG: methionyl-tRNA formyltransferase [Pseudomonadota bacterium]
MKWAFAGTPVFAERILTALLAAGYRPEFVLSQPDRPSGRGMKLQASPVKQRAEAHGITVIQPLRLKGNVALFKDIANYDLDVLIVVAYGLIVPLEILSLPRWGCWNVHASLLPRWRGAAPIHRALQAGDTETGIGIMRMEEGLDTGPQYSILRTPIDDRDTTGTLHDRLADLGVVGLLDTLRQAEQGTLKIPVPQDEEGVSYAQKISPAEAQLNWFQPAIELDRMIRAFNPNPGAWTMLLGERLKIWEARILPESDQVSLEPIVSTRLPGSVFEYQQAPCVLGGDQRALQLHTVQKAGAQRMSASQWWMAEHSKQSECRFESMKQEKDN